MANLDQNQLQIFPIQNQVQTTKGPLAVRVFMDFASQTEYDIDLQAIQSRNQFDMCQTIFVDNSQGGSAVTITFPTSGFVIVAKSGTQGFYQVICPNPIKIVCTSAGGAPCTMFLIDVAVPGAVWPTT